MRRKMRATGLNVYTRDEFNMHSYGETLMPFLRRSRRLLRDRNIFRQLVWTIVGRIPSLKEIVRAVFCLKGTE